MAVIEHPDMDTRRTPAAAEALWIAAEPASERAARDDLRAQIAHLERSLAHVAAAAYPRLDMSPVTPQLHHRTPRVLALGELEQVRDALADRLATLRRAALRQAEEQADAREELERMLAEPRAYRDRRMTNAQLGLPGCTVYTVVPRLGVVGRLAGWWQVKVSSGCPLAWVDRSSWMTRRRGPSQRSIGRASMWWTTWVAADRRLATVHGGEAPRESVDPGLAWGP